MSFRLRLTLMASLAVAVAIVGAAVVVYYTDRSELIGQLDNDLIATVGRPPLNLRFGPPGQVTEIQGVAFGSSAVTAHVRRVVTPREFKIVLPRSFTAVQVRVRPPGAGPVGAATWRYSTVTDAGVPLRLLTLKLPTETVMISGSLVEIDGNLDRLRWLLIFICLGGIGAAAVLGSLVSRTAVAPLRRLTEMTERIVETGDLSQRTGQRGRDEISRLSTRLDQLLATLEESLRSQRQLVADASHELRTPIATLRANFELLAASDGPEPTERADLEADVRDELESMTVLVGELVELARGEERDVQPCAFRLDEVVQIAVERAARRAPELSFRTRLEPSLVVGVPERIERAVANLLDNARKWSPARQVVDVAVREGQVEVRDHGPGIAAEDVPLVFDRFYRSTAARGMPGAGLGLAIVKQIADAHGGSVTVEQAPGGGAILRLQLATVS